MHLAARSLLSLSPRPTTSSGPGVPSLTTTRSTCASWTAGPVSPSTSTSASSPRGRTSLPLWCGLPMGTRPRTGSWPPTGTSSATPRTWMRTSPSTSLWWISTVTVSSVGASASISSSPRITRITLIRCGVLSLSVLSIIKNNWWWWWWWYMAGRNNNKITATSFKN